MRRTIRTMTSLLAALLLSVVVAGAAFAQDANYPPGVSEEEAEPQKDEVAPGDIQRMTLTGLAANSSGTWQVTYNANAMGFAGDGVLAAATLAQASNVISGTFTADDDGVAVVAFRIPSDWGDGTATFRAEGVDEDGNPVVFETTFEIDSALPVTGGDFTVGMGLAAVVLVLGAALVLVSRKKTREFEIEAQ